MGRVICRNGRSIAIAAAWTLLATLLAGFAVAEEPLPILPGDLQILVPEGVAGSCPLDRTEVETDIVGFVARTTVKQVFRNPLQDKIEAIYVFPLPRDAAVDDMVMLVGDRRITGQIKERAEARRIYETAKRAGHVASLLDQERPNIFTQAVANIEPGAEVTIEISYVETLKFEDGVFEWVFPMVVGPRYIPGGGSAPAPMTLGQATGQVPDGDRITPPVVPEGMRAGHDISIRVSLDAGTEIHDLESVLHEVDARATGGTRATIALTDRKTIPNRDFILRYRLSTDAIGNTFLAHRDERGAFFTLILQPPRRVEPRHVVARELIFVLDTSGSMSGFPMEKSKEVVSRLIDTMNGADTFNVITFAGNTDVLWSEPRPNSSRNRAEALSFITSRRGAGGTEMMQAIRTALRQPDGGEQDRLRIVCFLTDGYVGNDMAIIDAVKRNADTTRVFSFGIGNSVNRYLLDGMAHASRGEAEFVTLASDATEAVERFHTRVLSPVLTKIEIDWGNLPVEEIYPQRVPDLFSAKPIMLHGRLTGAASGSIVLNGQTGAGDYRQTIDVVDIETAGDRRSIPSLWARGKIDDLMNRDLAALQRGNFPEDLKSRIVELGITYRLMTPFTSFVAVEEMVVTLGGEPRTVHVPVEMPEGVSHEGVFGGTVQTGRARHAPKAKMAVPHVSLAGQPTRTIRTEEADRAARDVAPTDKLAASLRGLAERVERSGERGNLTSEELIVVNYRVDVMIYLRDLSEETLRALSELGFVQAAEGRAVRLLVGSIDVRKLGELAALTAVVAVTPIDD